MNPFSMNEINLDSTSLSQLFNMLGRACDQCRKKKVKCNNLEGACTNCLNHNMECTYLDNVQKRGAKTKQDIWTLSPSIGEFSSDQLTTPISYNTPMNSSPNLPTSPMNQDLHLNPEDDDVDPFDIEKKSGPFSKPIKTPTLYCVPIPPKLQNELNIFMEYLNPMLNVITPQQLEKRIHRPMTPNFLLLVTCMSVAASLLFLQLLSNEVNLEDYQFAKELLNCSDSDDLLDLDFAMGKKIMEFVDNEIGMK